MGNKVIFINTVKAIIDEWDPIDLLSHAPSDEYHSEIEEVERLLKSTKNVTELAISIYNVFLESFDADIFQKTQSECILIAQKILSSTM